MNKMLFSEGGQPLYIDDLKTLQENPTNQMSALLQALGANTSAFLLERFQGELKKLNEGDKTTTFQTKKNWLVLDGIIYEIKETTLVAHSWNDPLYVGVRKSTSDVRIFEDGQERACRETAEAFLTFEKTGGVFNVSELKTLFDLIAPSIVVKLSETEYKDMPWVLMNGYSGQIQSKVRSDYTIIKVDVQSEKSEWTDGPGVIFEYPTTRVPVPPIVSGAIVVGVSSDNGQEQIVHIQVLSGKGKLVGSLGTSSLPSPANCPINTYFIIPK